MFVDENMNVETNVAGYTVGGTHTGHFGGGCDVSGAGRGGQEGSGGENKKQREKNRY